MMKVLVTQPIPESGLEILQSRFEVEVAGQILSKDEILAKIVDKDILVCSTNNTVDADVINTGRRLKVISSIGKGVDHIDLVSAGSAGILVLNTPGLLMQAVAEFVFTHILSLARRIVEADNYVRSGQFEKHWDFNLLTGMELKGKTLGVIGFGSIGRHLLPIAQGFGMNVLYTNRRGELDEFKSDPSVTFATKEHLLAKSDFVIVLLPLTETTVHFITYAELLMMKPSAFLINMARGKIIKEIDLVRALQEKKIAGAGLDVFEYEPKVASELLSMPNTILTPHIGAATKEARAAVAKVAAQNVIDVLEKQELSNVVNIQYLLAS